MIEINQHDIIYAIDPKAIEAISVTLPGTSSQTAALWIVFSYRDFNIEFDTNRECLEAYRSLMEARESENCPVCEARKKTNRERVARSRAKERKNVEDS